MKKNIQSDQSNLFPTYIEASPNTVETPNTSIGTRFTTDDSSDTPISNHNAENSLRGFDQSKQISFTNIKLVPIKVEDIVKMFKENPDYRGKSPGLIKIKENDIDKIIKQQTYQIEKNTSTSKQESLTGISHENPTFLKKIEKENTYIPGHLLREELSPRSLRHSLLEEQKNSFQNSSKQGREQFSSLLAGETQQQLYAMPNIHAYPMVGGSGFRIDKSRRKKTPRAKSRTKITPAKRIVRKSRKNKHSRSRKPSRSRSRVRSRSRQPRSRSIKVHRLRSKKSPVVIVRNRRNQPIDPISCSPCPSYEINCQETNQSPKYFLHRNTSAQSNICCCNICTEKLNFIQPRVCSKKKYMWTNEYAIIPKPQFNYIDPCEELDPAIYPRANNPCIRDGRGNPLTDCIGIPLTDRTGKKCLGFNANGSVIDTNFRGNFYTRQPPVCVKCTFPNNYCIPNTTHNW